MTVAASLLLLTGCRSYIGESIYLTFPPAPKLTWEACQSPTNEARICLSETDGAALAKWMDKVRAFNAARDRLQRY